MDRDSQATGGPVSRWLSTAQPEALFVLSAIAQYIGAVLAVLLFDGSIGGTDGVAPQTVAWFRAIGAAIALLAVSRGWRSGWTREQLVAVAIFGITTVLMNVFFYLAIERIDLGKGITIEFIGPIAVAAATTRSRRNAIALLFAFAGVVVLGGVEIDDNLLGVVFILIASALWAGYIVVGSRVAQVDRGVAGLGLGLAIGALVLAPVGAPGSAEVWTSPTPARALPRRRRVLERHRLRHRPVHDAEDSGPTVLAAARAAPGHRHAHRVDRSRTATVAGRHARHRTRARRRGRPRT